MENSSNEIILDVKIIPNSSKNEILKKEKNFLIIKIKQKREQSKANKELIYFLSKILNIDQSNIKIIKGKNSIKKQILIKTKNKTITDILLK